MKTNYINPEKEFNHFLEGIKARGLDEVVVKKAWDFALLAHHGQKRKTGEPFVVHCLEVAKQLNDWKLDQDSIVAGLLHDTVEDGGAKFEDIEKEFNGDVSKLVAGVTKISDIRLRGSQSEAFIENLRKMFLAMAKDLRVILVKLADRLHNMKTLWGVDPEKRKRIAEETLSIYAPLAERLGMGEVKSQMDDLAFPYVYPEEYERVKKESKKYYKDAEKQVVKVKRTILKALANHDLSVKISGRKKHLYSLWKKLNRPEIEWDFEKIQDIVALRIITKSISQCYTALGVVHQLYKPVPHLGISDFIAQPKPNGYQSIHTKVFGVNGRIIEIQIRTEEMHEQAEHGIAAHWFLSDLKSKGKFTSEDVEKGELAMVKGNKLTWVRQLADWQKEIKDQSEYLEAVKFDALGERIFVFSPMGDVYDLPNGATPVDFAYAVHSNLGNFVKAAKVNAKLVPLNHILKSGDVVEIIKQKNEKGPTKDWIGFVNTTLAKREINKYLRKN
ncbi:MAG TPA: RelA/SpoT family protein [Patescibacteria group bacterium]|nr:RelA/SpoT family protein [Patescibacteria group bacterium]